MTLAQLKREANAQSISAEMIYRYGKEIPERLRGIRKATRANTVSIFFQNADGSESELHIRAASLIDYDGETLTIYEAGRREMTDQEQKIVYEANTERKRYEEKYPHSESWFVTSAFIRKNYPDFEYLTGHETKRGKRKNYDGTITDNAIKGEAIIKYRIIHH